MPRTRIERADQPALPMEDLRELSGEALCLLTPLEIAVELDSLRTVLDLPKKSTRPEDMDDVEWDEAITWLSKNLGASYVSVGMAIWRSQTNDRDRAALSARFEQVAAALKTAERAVDSTSPASGVLLPATLARRVDVLLRGMLPLVWVRALDVAKF